MLQHIRCSALHQARMTVRPRSSRKAMSSCPRASFSPTTSASGRGDGRGSSSGRSGPLPTLSGAAAAIGGVAALACIAATAESWRSGPALAAAAAPTRSAISAVVDKEEEKENAALVAAAHELRRSLTPPHQSLFRVVCILVYEDLAGKLHRITGTNAEASTIGGSICAERAAMCKLREASDCKRVTKIVVVTDNPGPLAPGVLCREFLSAHLSPSTPVVMAGTGGDGGDGGDVLRGLLYDEELDQKPPPEAVVPSGTMAEIGSADGSSSGSGGGSGGGGSAQTVALRTPSRGGAASSTCACRAVAATAAGDGGNGGRGYVNVCTVGDLYPWRNMYGVTGRRELLRLGFLRQQVAEELAKPGLAEALGLDNGVLEAHDAAWRATAEDKRDGVHPIRYAAVALFTDGEAEIAHQLKALEYGATLDPVTLLAPAMLRRAKEGIRPSWIIVCDQFGLMHAPFAQARTFLSEHGFGETKVPVHAEDGAVVVVRAKDLVPTITTPR